MKTTLIPNEMETRAAAALGALLHQVSSIKTRDITFQPVRRKSDILADIDVLGHNHRLVCNVADEQPGNVQRALKKLRTCSDGRHGATPVLITLHASPQTRAMCEKSHIGFLDLDGNARLEVGEVFIGKRSVRSAYASPESQRYMA